MSLYSLYCIVINPQINIVANMKQNHIVTKYFKPHMGVVGTYVIFFHKNTLPCTLGPSIIKSMFVCTMKTI